MQLTVEREKDSDASSKRELDTLSYIHKLQ